MRKKKQNQLRNEVYDWYLHDPVETTPSTRKTSTAKKGRGKTKLQEEEDENDESPMPNDEDEDDLNEAVSDEDVNEFKPGQTKPTPSPVSVCSVFSLGFR